MKVPISAISALLVCGASAVGVSRAELPAGHEVDTAVCLVCHDLSAELGAANPHAPVASGECVACHNPHASRFDALLRDRPAPLCIACHEEIGRALERPVLHDPVAEGRCADCHAPHGSDHAGLLVTAPGQLCQSCHENISEWTQRPVRHAPFAAGECADCHDPHAAEHTGLLVSSPGQLCATCHEVTAEFTRVHGGYPVNRAQCQQCHDPHASPRQGLLRAKLHAPFEDGDCTTCHVDARAANPFALIAPQTELCGTCHAEQVEDSRKATFAHVSAGGGRCTDCHNPHTGDGAGLLKQPQRALCLSCHDPGGAKSGQTGRFSTHADQDCTTCHSAHGAERPVLLAEGPIELCGNCHSHEHGIIHPMGAETRDPRSGNPMTCLSCHGIHDAPFEMYLRASEERDLCVGCHKDIGGGGR